MHPGNIPRFQNAKILLKNREYLLVHGHHLTIIQIHDYELSIINVAII
jgi:hypothetical protein